VLQSLRDVPEIAQDYLRYRDLLVQFVVRDVKLRYKQAVMGFGWAIFMPLLIVLSGTVVRLAMAHLTGDRLSAHATAGLVVKAVPWAFFVGAIGFAQASLLGNATLVTKIYFPREVLPLAAVLAQAFDSAVSSAAVALALPFLGVRLSLAMLWVPVLIGLLVLLTAALALFLSAANVFFRDVKYLVQALLTFGIFFTPVFYEPSMLGPGGAYLVMLNPLSPILEGLRLSIVEGHSLLVPFGAWAPWHLAYAAAWALGGLVAASLLFHRLETLFAEYA
jgi:ABC-type polysaccharide/polyol phosphate export permease